MVTGASTAHLAVILIDARHGIIEQSRRHTCLSSLLGIRHMVAAVNKMDLVDWDESRFREIESEFTALAGQLGVHDARAFPISALNGDNVVERGAADWYDGPPLLEHLEAVDVAGERGAGPLRLPVQWVIRPEDGARGERRYAGQLAGGTLRAGDEVVVLPAGSRTTVTSVETHDGPLESAAPPDSVSVQLAARPRRRPRRDALRPGRAARRWAAGSRRRSAGWPSSRCARASTSRSSTRRARCARPSSRSTRCST